MFLSCSLFKPQKPEVYTLLSKKGTYSYQDDYKLYIKSAQEQRILEPTAFGKLIELYYDDTMVLRKMDEKTLEIKLEPTRYTEGPKNLYLFYREPLNNILGIFASSSVSTKISRIITDVTRSMQEEPFFQPLKNLRFTLKEKENEINKIEAFGETIEVRVSDIHDPYIADVWLKGSSIDHSVEYEKLIRDPTIGGMVEYMAISYQEKTYYLFSDGRLFTRQASDNIFQEIYPIFGITQKLCEVGAVQF